MKYGAMAIMFMSVNVLNCKQVLQDPKKILLDNITYFEEKGGGVTDQEREDIKQKAQEIIQPDEAKRLTIKVGMRGLEKSLLTESYDHHLVDQWTPEDVSVALESIDYLRTALDNGAGYLSQVLTATQNTEDFNTQLCHAFACLLTLILEVEKALEKIEFKVKANKAYDDAGATFKFHIVPADLVRYLYTINTSIYEKVPSA